MESFIAGSTSGAISCVLFQPLDLIKTKLQSSSQKHDLKAKTHHVVVNGKLNPKHTFSQRSMYALLNQVIRQDSVFGLWKGLTPSLYRTVPGVGMYFCTLHTMKSVFNNEPTFYENLTLGFSARAMVGTALLPMTVVKARYESGKYNYKTVSDGLLTIWRAEGVRGLFSGCTPTILRDAPYSGLYLMFYSHGKNLVRSASHSEETQTYEHFACGLVAGIMASLVTHPFDVIKTQIQLYPYKYRGTAHCISVVFSEYGFAGFMRGVTPRCLRRTLISALSWTVFEEIMKQLKLKV
jgi:solute carrier family 25 protein 38